VQQTVDSSKQGIRGQVEGRIHGGMARLSWPRWLGRIRRRYTRERKVTHFGSNL